jgi:glycosyltransferase involved in cell wall biosynthesis
LISVITCTHNPREEFLTRVANSLSKQTLPKGQFEWIVVDNQSITPVSSWLDLEGLQSTRIIHEDELGLTPARLRGIAEAKFPVIIFVDDDNVLDADYLQTAKELLNEHQTLGVIGGSTVGEFETEPPKWFDRREFEMLGVRPVSIDQWGHQRGNWAISPIGAGMVLRREVAEEYKRKVATDLQRQQLDRRGDSLVSGGDDDIANTALDLGYGIGRFTKLRLLHLIPEERLTLKYLSRLAEGIGYSGRLLSRMNSNSGVEKSPRWFMRIRWLRPWIVRFRRPQPLKRIDQSFSDGESRADREWQQKNAR